MTARSIVLALRGDHYPEDDDGENWALLDDTADPSVVKFGSVFVAGTPRFWSVVRVTVVDADGQVHFRKLDEDDPGVSGIGRVDNRSVASGDGRRARPIPLAGR